MSAPTFVHEVLAEAAQRVSPVCLLCREVTLNLALFLPRDSQLYGGRPGKQRIVAYRLCDAHMDADTDVIEGLLLGTARGAA